MLELLFIHVPKAGGTSINQAIKAKYRERLFVDDDGPANPISEMNLDPDGCLERFNYRATDVLTEKTAVTGHLWVRKYDRVSIRLRATVLRHPVARLISHYFFWMSPVILSEHPLRDYVVRLQLDIIEFARLPIMRRFYSCHLFRDADMTSFDFIFDSEELKRNWGRVINSLSLEPTPAIFANPTSMHLRSYEEQRFEIVNNPSILKRLEDILAEDIRFYEMALKR